ncbi:tRNA lysidine(34) synthetase TilS [Nocardioides sp. cx-169]|uniref:tRNA lysidine(34) synthetase TilS n=1 Tax=Nocardioides sp. cx-169 TaxID=2899080 RepID=UPI001E46B6E2|nr:tRNA lysidine(34) synthetase TilS [Nocardioides sp. cx-169]MCD4532649.1 tRNA lysidine(34) synthetase TilS [Nocardioides sp. cx-169]
MSLDADVAAVRLAVRRHGVADLGDGAVLVACSGGADSLALLAATVFETRAAGGRVVGVTVDHGLQDGSAEHAARVVAQMAHVGADETCSARVQVEPAGRGPEAAAREARYAVLEQMAEHFGSSTVLLGHTLDDQAETVLLGLTRGSGGRSIAGMRPAFDVFRRPLLGVRRSQTVAACRAEDLDFWSDPHNADPRFTRSRVRHTVLPTLERELGPGVAETLARTAEQLRPDMEALDRFAETAFARYHDDVVGFEVAEIATLEPAVRTRMLRLAALRAGCPSGELFAVHIDALERQVANRDRLPKAIQLPGHVTAYRQGDHLRFAAASVES